METFIAKVLFLSYWNLFSKELWHFVLKRETQNANRMTSDMIDREYALSKKKEYSHFKRMIRDACSFYVTSFCIHNEKFNYARG